MKPKQLEVLHFIRRWQIEHRFSPSMREVATGLNKSRSMVNKLIDVLVEKGWLEKDPRGEIKMYNPYYPVYSM